MDKHYDILVAGAGSAGFTAAVMAGRLGKRVLLVEKNGMPGGILTVGGNNDIAQFWAHQKPLIAGIGWEYCLRLEKIGGAEIPDMKQVYPHHWQYGVHVSIPLAAHMMDEMLLEAGVDICYEQTLCAVNTEKWDGQTQIVSAVITSKSGLITVRADTYIDCTGDGDLSVFSGAEYELGEPDENGLSLQPGTIRYYMNRPPADRAEHDRITAVLRKAEAEGLLTGGDLCRRGYNSIAASRGNNANHISRFNGADSEDKTRADIEGRRCVARIIAALRAAGIDPDIITVAPETAMRETRRIVCDGRITAEDYVAARRYPDGICHSFYPIDLHRDGTGGIYQVFLTDGQMPSIPLSAMTVKGVRNLYVAGRCACGDRLANSAYRVKASCMAMGQACGAAAALAVDTTDGASRGIDIDTLRKNLADSGAIVPEKGE
ncbi:MAG: FAD-dependent oxidoreductase [Ruminococcaceae bacterium]|nr:FAD-dependent oxidoreductase [Oscillospiraceae bacterium]